MGIDFKYTENYYKEKLIAVIKSRLGPHYTVQQYGDSLFVNKYYKKGWFGCEEYKIATINTREKSVKIFGRINLMTFAEIPQLAKYDFFLDSEEEKYLYPACEPY